MGDYFDHGDSPVEHSLHRVTTTDGTHAQEITACCPRRVCPTCGRPVAEQRFPPYYPNYPPVPHWGPYWYWDHQRQVAPPPRIWYDIIQPVGADMISVAGVQ